MNSMGNNYSENQPLVVTIPLAVHCDPMHASFMLKMNVGSSMITILVQRLVKLSRDEF